VFIRWLKRWLKWRLKGKPMIHYSGFHCSCCGKWVDKCFSIPEYQSVDEWWDTWGICEECKRKYGYVDKKKEVR